MAGLAGLLFSPIAARLRGIYLGLASLGLVFLGEHILFNATALTGGFNGRDVEPLTVLGFTFANDDPGGFTVLGVTYGGWRGSGISHRPGRRGVVGLRAQPRRRDGPAGRWQPCATARSRQRPWAST